MTRVLVVGAQNSGKQTLMKQLRVFYNGSLLDFDLLKLRNKQDITQNMRSLVALMLNKGCLLPTDLVQQLFTKVFQFYYIYTQQCIISTTLPRMQTPTPIHLQTPADFPKNIKGSISESKYGCFSSYFISDLVFHFSYRPLFLKYSSNINQFLISAILMYIMTQIV
ncbi:G_protein alpha subunit [Hexamita inflata]|uniref:Helical insertion n=1 Tax=Hexamita inflata TaxID=28002 RepID=A0AA86TYG5_9EUKA|nr:G protein alpha subunit [Hexamita inflata]